MVEIIFEIDFTQQIQFLFSTQETKWFSFFVVARVACSLFSKVVSQNMFFWHQSLKSLFFLNFKGDDEEGHSLPPPALECWKHFPMYQISPAGRKQDPVLSVDPWTFLTSGNKFQCQQSLFLQTGYIQTFLLKNKATPLLKRLLVPVTLFPCNLFLRKYYPCNSIESVDPSTLCLPSAGC